MLSSTVTITADGRRFGHRREVMQSYAVARAMASLVATGRFAEVDLSLLARDRFDDPARWVTEDLHI